MVTPAPTVDATHFDPLEEILRLCAAAAPAPWYPRDFAKLSGISLGELAVDVEFLWQEGLLRPASQPGDVVPGVTLTDAGARALADPEGLAALRDGLHATRTRDTAARRTLREVGPPVVSRVLLVINVLVFAAGFLLAMGRGSGQAFLAGNGTITVLEVLHRSGSVSADDIIAGQWWRLLTAAFVHGSVLHLVMNMSMLAFGLGLTETMWGRSRYLLIYLVAAFGGNCLAVAWPTFIEIRLAGGAGEIAQPVVGASGALCGVLASMMTWLLLNGRHLPRGAASQLRTSLIAAGVLLVYISLFPQVSGLCHLGGALFGAGAAALLHFQRWSTGLMRWAAMAGLVALPWGGLRIIDHERATDPRWPKAEHRIFEQLYKQRIADVAGESVWVYQRRIAPLLKEPPRKRDAGRIERALAEAASRQPALVVLASDLARAGPYHDPDTEREREGARAWAEELAEKFAKAEDVLRRNVNAAEEDDVEERAFSRQFLSRIPDTMGRAIKLYRDEVQPLLKTSPRERDRATVDKVALDVDRMQHELTDLTTALGEAGPYGNEQVEPARLMAERYAAARTALMEATARCLRSGENWTPADEAALQKQADEVASLRSEWEKLVERQ
jgi:membrane associated rhomboid family serine protease